MSRRADGEVVILRLRRLLDLVQSPRGAHFLRHASAGVHFASVGAASTLAITRSVLLRLVVGFDAAERIVDHEEFLRIRVPNIELATKPRRAYTPLLILAGGMALCAFCLAPEHLERVLDLIRLEEAHGLFGALTLAHELTPTRAALRPALLLLEAPHAAHARLAQVFCAGAVGAVFHTELLLVQALIAHHLTHAEQLVAHLP
mmetsp:Transcript_52209/g.118031  ORF Transcript_52209/g.118031 Transcript_52209/m.118031 type:complete len:203 (+) Transcript_52209:112-720(+)